MRVHRRSAAAGGMLALLGLLAACTLGPSQRPGLATYGSGPTTSASTTVTGSAAGPGRRGAPISWQRCPEVNPVDPATGQRFDVDCASVVTDRPAVSGPGRRTFEVARARAAGVGSDAPVLVVLDGPPGRHGRADVAAVAAGLSPAVREHFAVVTVDLVGSGESDPIDCVGRSDTATLSTLGADPTRAADRKALADLTRSITFECTDVGGPDIPLINSTEAADDLDRLRDALGTDRLTVLGRGFGATLAAVYADRYPGRLQAAVLDAPANPLDPMDTRATAVAVASEAALDRFAAACPAFAGGCPLGADPRATIAALVQDLDRSASPGTGRVTGGTVLLTLLLRLGNPDDWPELATALAAAANGNTDPIAADLVAALHLDTDPTGLDATLIYSCNDSTVRLSTDQLDGAVEDVRAQAPLFGAYVLGLIALCGSWPAPETALGGVKANGAPPILVLGAVDDPVAPYEAVRALSGQLASATLVSWQSGRHGSYPASTCAAGAVDAYLIQGTIPPVGTLCPP